MYVHKFTKKIIIFLPFCYIYIYLKCLHWEQSETEVKFLLCLPTLQIKPTKIFHVLLHLIFCLFTIGKCQVLIKTYFLYVYPVYYISCNFTIWSNTQINTCWKYNIGLQYPLQTSLVVCCRLLLWWNTHQCSCNIAEFSYIHHSL